jgi:hypothetical protein
MPQPERQLRRDRVQALYFEYSRAIGALGTDCIDAEYQANAIECVDEANDLLMRGFRARDDECRAEEDKRILKAYREGRLVEK